METTTLTFCIVTIVGILVLGVVGIAIFSRRRPVQNAKNSQPPVPNTSVAPGISQTEDIKLQRVTSLHFSREQILQEGSVVISTEDIPLDNRFGSNTLVSEHEFTQTASTSLKIDRNREIAGRIQVGLWSVLEGELRNQVSRNLGIEIGTQVTRRVSLKFEAAAGKLVRYRVVWKQNTRRGIIEATTGRETFQIPYEAMYGLYHSVDSVSTNDNG